MVVGNVFSYFKGFEAYPEHLRELFHWTVSYRPKGYQFSPSFRSRKWDGYYHLLNVKGQFPSGLCAEFERVCGEKNIPLKVIFNEKFDYERAELDWNGDIELRDYQKDSVDAFIAGHRGIIESPTRTGKTYISAKIIQKIGFRTIFLVHGVEALQQTVEDLKLCLPGIDVGVYGGGKKQVGRWVTVGLIQSFSRVKNVDEFNKCGLMILDEVHLSAADSIYRFFLKIEAPYRLGISGTPFREDNRDLKMIALTGSILHRINQKDMWDEGFIERPKIVWLCPRAKFVNRSMIYRHHYLKGIISCKERNDLVLRLIEKHEGKQMLISVENIEHGHKVMDSIGDVYDVKFIHGGLKKKEREGIFEEFRTGILSIVVATRVFNASLTFPHLEIMVNMAGRKSTVELLQKYGRAQGKGPIKKEVFIYDFVDKHSDYLYKHSVSRMKELKKRGYEQLNLEAFQ